MIGGIDTRGGKLWSETGNMGYNIEKIALKGYTKALVLSPALFPPARPKFKGRCKPLTVIIAGSDCDTIA